MQSEALQGEEVVEAAGRGEAEGRSTPEDSKEQR